MASIDETTERATVGKTGFSNLMSQNNKRQSHDHK